MNNSNNPNFSSSRNSDASSVTREKTRYKYIVYDKEGKQVKGYFDAFRRSDVESFLVTQGYKILEIKPVKISKLSSFLTFQNEMRYKDLVFFLTQLSTYIKSGIPLTDSIVILENQTKNKKNKNLFKRIVYELNTGANFSEALARQGKTFPRLLINMLKTSELTGNLTEALDDMAAYYKTADSNRKQIISALTYPSVVLVIAVVVLVFLLIFIVPKFEGIFSQLGSELPWITLLLINMSNFIQNNIIKIVLVFVAICIIGVAMYKNIKKFRYAVQWLVMHIPVIKDVIIYNEVVMFTKTFSSLVRHDVFITDSIEMLGKVTNNEIYKGIIKEAVNNLSTGAGLSKAFENKRAFPRIAYEMLVTGEKTGRLGVMMENVANYYEEEQKNLVQRLKSLIEPAMIIMLALVVGVILMAIFVPMFGMYENIL
ncbi:MAG: type II secretion system F family protein [Bacilli bacterium]|nr:type II secretion system F family protein [Bacilli bacterium]